MFTTFQSPHARLLLAFFARSQKQRSSPRLPAECRARSFRRSRRRQQQSGWRMERTNAQRPIRRQRAILLASAQADVPLTEACTLPASRRIRRQ